MHELIPSKYKISIVVGAVLVLLVLFALYSHAENPQTTLFGPRVFLDGFAWIVSVLGVVSIALGNDRAWAFIARPWLLRLFGIPPLLGHWQGTIRSNYPRLDALRTSARDAASVRHDADSPAFVDSHPLLVREASLHVVGSLWKIKVVLVTGPAGDGHQGIRSESVASRAIRTADGAIEVWYVYRATNHDEPAGNDSAVHLGAAILTFGLGGCTGVYWTERNWNKGMNTAGRMAFSLQDGK